MSDTTVDELAARYWDQRLAADPIEATLLGDHRFDGEVPELTSQAFAAADAQQKALMQQLIAVDTAVLSATHRVTWQALRGELENDLATGAARMFDWSVDPREGPQVSLLNLGLLQTADNREQAQALLSRWQKLERMVDQRTALLREGLARDRTSPQVNVVRVLAQLDDLLATPEAEWTLAAVARRDLAWSPDALRSGVMAALAGLRSAFVRMRAFLHDQALPRSRDDAHAGVGHIPGGAADYERFIRVQTGLQLTAGRIHEIGLAEVAKIRAEMSALGARLFGTTDVAAIQERLRSDPALHFSTRDQVEAKAVEALARAQAAMPGFFSRIPRTPCVVKRIEAFEEKDTYVAYYRQPAVDGSRPGTYYINTYAPETRTRYEAEALAFHESVPGHHTQIAIAQELPDVPEFRRHLGVTSYVEGWALYAERLADEMGLYSGDLDRIGMLSFDAWRACRLVVDTGLHARGWSRAQAVAFLHENTALAANNITNEVDRYIGWPAQALSYKLGNLEMWRLRRAAQDQLGARFDLRAFHDVVLRNGAVSLAVLGDEVARWVDSETIRKL